MFLLKFIIQIIAFIISALIILLIGGALGALVWGALTGDWFIAALIFFPIIAWMTTTT